jgi:hypothetical protein
VGGGKRKERANERGSVAAVAGGRENDGHVLRAPLPQRPPSIEFLTLDYPLLCYWQSLQHSDDVGRDARRICCWYGSQYLAYQPVSSWGGESLPS